MKPHYRVPAKLFKHVATDNYVITSVSKVYDNDTLIKLEATTVGNNYIANVKGSPF